MQMNHIARRMAVLTGLAAVMTLYFCALRPEGPENGAEAGNGDLVRVTFPARVLFQPPGSGDGDFAAKVLAPWVDSVVAFSVYRLFERYDTSYHYDYCNLTQAQLDAFTGHGNLAPQNVAFMQECFMRHPSNHFLASTKLEVTDDSITGEVYIRKNAETRIIILLVRNDSIIEEGSLSYYDFSSDAAWEDYTYYPFQDDSAQSPANPGGGGWSQWLVEDYRTRTYSWADTNPVNIVPQLITCANDWMPISAYDSMQCPGLHIPAGWFGDSSRIPGNNSAPYFLSSRYNLNRYVTLGQTYRDTLQAQDFDSADVLTFSLISGPPGFYLSDSTVIWTPAGVPADTFLCSARVSDGRGGYDTTDWDIIVQDSAAGRTWTVYNTGDPNGVLGICWAGGQYIAVGENGVAFTSPDAQNWVLQYSGTMLPLLGVAWSGSLAVAAGVSGAIFTSADGMYWTDHSDTTVTIVQEVRWTGAEFVAMGQGPNGGLYMYSTDGINWNKSRPGSLNIFSDMMDGVTTVCVGDSGGIFTTTDRRTWTPQASGTTETLFSDNWNGAQWVAVGYNGTILTSPDAVAWTVRYSGTANSLNDVVWTGSGWVAVGDGGTILSSPDGITWTPETSGTTQFLNRVIVNGSTLIAVGGAGTVLIGQ